MFSIRKLAASLFVRPAAPAGRLAPLACEALEGRDCPAKYWWVGDFNTQYAFFSPGPPGKNWVVSETRPTNVSQSTPRPGGPPGSADDLMFDGAVSKGDCYWGEGPPLVGSIHLVNGFGHTVDMNRSVTVAGPGPGPDNFAFELRSGTIKQAEGTTLTVQGKAEWTGGDLNVTDKVANLVFTGAAAVALINPAGGTLKTNNNIAVDVGAKLNIINGTVLSALDTGILVAGASTLTAETVSLTVATTATKVVTITGGSSAQLTGVFTHRGLYVTDGTAKVLGQNKTTTFADKDVLISRADATAFPSVLVIENGATLDVGAGRVAVLGGKLATQATAGGPQPDAVIKAYALLIDRPFAEVSISDVIYNPKKANGADDLVHKYGQLEVQGFTQWMAGGYRPVCDPADQNNADRWISTKKFLVNGQPPGQGGAVLDPVWNGNAPMNNNEYTVLESHKGIFRATAGAVMPNILPVNANQKKLWAWVEGTAYDENADAGITFWRIIRIN